MQVVDHEPYRWFLFLEGDTLLLDVNCDHSAVGYSIMIQLNDAEQLEYFQNGRAFLNGLAQAIQDSGPGQGYQLRNVTDTYSEESMAAVNEWRETEK